MQDLEREGALGDRGTSNWVVRISQVFENLTDEIFLALGARVIKRLGSEYFLVKLTEPDLPWKEEASLYVRWKMPVDHAWPCHPERMENFVEKAAQGLARKFVGRHPQAILVGALDGGQANSYYRRLASNLRGRTLQLFPGKMVGTHEVESQKPNEGSLFCMVGEEGLYAGVESPQVCGGFYPGGTKFVKQGSENAISRAGAKIAEALHYLRLEMELPAAGSHWLELGASPGGMTAELLARGYEVTAIDRAPLDRRLEGVANLRFIQVGVGDFGVAGRKKFDGILCDMNGDAVEAISEVVRLSEGLISDGLVVFTLKTPGVLGFSEMNALYGRVLRVAHEGGLEFVAKTHLTYNRLEFTLFFAKGG